MQDGEGTPVSDTSAMPAQFDASVGDATPWTVLSPDGSLAGGATPSLDGDELLGLLRLMVLSRVFDDKAFSLQRQGRFGTFSPVKGQEASVVGSAAALDPQRDWIVPQYREMPALVRHGLPLSRFMSYFMGNPIGGQIPEGVRCLPLQISLAAQLPHAVGLAWGERLQGSDSVVVVYFGDGASSEGDFHEACNLAGVMKAPVIFLLQNNGWAISTPVAQQSAAASFAARAPGYGFPGALVDGNDILAVHAVTEEAVRRARAGEGPTLIETRTYRMGPHNTADDPTRYADPEQLERWRLLDPVQRLQRYLAGLGVWDEAVGEQMANEAAAHVDEALAEARALPPPTPRHVFDHVFRELPPRLARQADQWSARYGTAGGQ